MEITHTWKVNKLVQKNDNSGLVIQVFYKVHSTDGEYFYVSGGNIQLNTENLDNFIPYENLTEELTVQWVKDNLGPSLGYHEQDNTYQINSFRTPSIPETKSDPLPWIILSVDPEEPPVDPL